MSAEMQAREADLRTALSYAVYLADGEAIDAASNLIDAVAEFLDIDRRDITIGRALREPASLIVEPEPEVCPICNHDEVSVWAASDEREDEADLVGCSECGWEAALTPEGAQARAGAR